MLAKIKDFVKDKFYDIILLVIIVLLVMLAFASGYIMAKYQSKEPIIIEQNNN
jgi:hypothetical protein